MEYLINTKYMTSVLLWIAVQSYKSKSIMIDGVFSAYE